MTLLRPAARALAAGLVGTTAMTGTSWAERGLRSRHEIPVDYDATGHVVTAACKVLRWHPRTRRQRQALFLLVHWGYGSAVALQHAALLSAGQSRRRARWTFYALCQATAFTLFPALGGTPPPWRWRRDVLASSLGQHLVYAVTVSAVAAHLDG